MRGNSSADFTFNVEIEKNLHTRVRQARLLKLEDVRKIFPPIQVQNRKAKKKSWLKFLHQQKDYWVIMEG